MKKILFSTLLLLLTLTSGAQVLEHRSWQLHDPDWNHLQKAIPMAAEEGMNRIQLSHNIVMDAEELWEKEGHEERLEVVRKAIALAHEHGLKVDMWTHEVSGVPEEYLAEDGRCVLNEDLWEWLGEKYEHLFDLVPELDGLVLTFSETDYAVYQNDKVISDEPEMKRIARMADAIYDVCLKRGKILMIRTFVHRPTELDWIGQAMQSIAESIEDQSQLVVMSKCVPHDWHPYFPYNPMLGNVGGMRQVVEIDLGQEYTGKSWILHGEVGYVRDVLEYARSKGVIGSVARVERKNLHALGTPNEVNIHAFSRLVRDPSLTTEQLWQEWTEGRYGAGAAQYLIPALKNTYDVTNIILYPQEQWINRHSELADWKYAYRHITDYKGYSVKSWLNSQKYERMHRELLHPVPETFLRIRNEKELARQLSRDCLENLERARPYLSEEDYSELLHYFELADQNIEIFEHHTLAFYKSLRLMDLEKVPGSEEEQEQLRREMKQHIGALRRLAGRMERLYSPHIAPGNPEKIMRFVRDIEKRLK
jgi:hypothetical protein